MKMKTIVTMKDFVLIDSELPNRFLTKAIKTINYFQNKPLTKTQNYDQIISKKT